MVMIFSCTGHSEIDFVEFVKYLWSFIEDSTKFSHIFFLLSLIFCRLSGMCKFKFLESKFS